MPKITVNGVVRDMTPDEEKEFKVKIEKDKEERIAYEKVKYRDDRQLEYPTIQECVHAILDNDLEALQAKRAEVKLKFPKPE